MSTTDPKHILVIMGSPRKGNTFHACEMFRELLEQEIPVQFDYIWLKDLTLHPCRGCLLCFTKGEQACPIHDDIPKIWEKMRKADAVIFASPVYAMNVTSLMKLMIDRFSFTFHRPEYFDKKAFLIATTGALGHEEVLKYLADVAGIWGFEVTGKAGLVTPIPVPAHLAERNQKTLQNAAHAFSEALRRSRRRSPGLKDVIIFHGQRAAFSQLMTQSPADYQYWKEKGWLDKKVKYFVPLPVNPLYHAIGVLVEWIATKKVKKDLITSSGAKE
ncbi:flavodoxin family protein [Methanospirillum hungatei]|uniref:flavodoxin family protein n=1 Tax=Methanospirillum hungatei TaxID=2203 RepID=UPI0026EF486F|nr:flavodoxin family protein [Methanospirillum hungatei]MCA1915123.1 flavodoxin family protein [Methanospirillum hungatei]